jgi:hypothetical protein
MGDSARGKEASGVVRRTHVTIADDTPSLSTREQVARSDETFDELLLQTKHVSRELGGIATSGD